MTFVSVGVSKPQVEVNGHSLTGIQVGEGKSIKGIEEGGHQSWLLSNSVTEEDEVICGEEVANIGDGLAVFNGAFGVCFELGFKEGYSGRTVLSDAHFESVALSTLVKRVKKQIFGIKILRFVWRYAEAVDLQDGIIAHQGGQHFFHITPSQNILRVVPIKQCDTVHLFEGDGLKSLQYLQHVIQCYEIKKFALAFACCRRISSSNMKTNQVLLCYTEFSGDESLPNEDAALLAAAIEARENAYAPYSNYKVGAALRLADGRVVVGNNQENAAYPSGLCAERVALFAARAQYSEQEILALAVVTAGVPGESPASPCGSCRQVMVEFEQLQQQSIRFIMANMSGDALVFERVSDLLPFCFTCAQLGKDVK